MTPLLKPVHRLSNKRVGKLPLVITLGPGTEKRDDLIGFRRLGERTQYVVTVSDVYRLAALWHGTKEHAARKAARREGVPWRKARREFLKANSIQRPPPKTKTEVGR